MSHGKDIERPGADLLPAVRAYILQQAMLAPGDRVVVGVSGGPDSAALLDLLFRLREAWGLILHVAHLNHCLRGKEAEADAAFVASLAERLGLPYHGGKADVKALARREGTSIEGAARIARHTFLETIRRRANADRIALGHTRSDQAETLLLRLLRGAGRRGLGAIRPVRDRIWIRPLLAVSRGQIESYLAYRNQEVRQDRTNRDTRFLRNRIRWELLPHLASAYTSKIEEILARTADVLQQEDDLLEQLADDALQKAANYQSRRKIILDAETVFGYHISLQRRVFRKVLQRLRAGSDAVDFLVIHNLLTRLAGRSQGVQISPEVSACRSENLLIFSRPAPSIQVEIHVPGRTDIPALGASLKVRVRPAKEIRAELQRLGPCRACIDPGCVEGKLLLRNRRAGDRFHPYGMSGTRKVSDFLIDCKIPAPLRDEVPLLTSGDTILWIVGLRTAGPAAVTDRTQEVLDVVFEGGWICSAVLSSARKRWVFL